MAKMCEKISYKTLFPSWTPLESRQLLPFRPLGCHWWKGALDMFPLNSLTGGRGSVCWRCLFTSSWSLDSILVGDAKKKKWSRFFLPSWDGKEKYCFLPDRGFKRLRQMVLQPQFSFCFTVWCPTYQPPVILQQVARHLRFGGVKWSRMDVFCETGHHGHIGGLEGISGHDFRHVFIANVLQRSFFMNQIANVQFILWADFLPIWASHISDLNSYLVREAPAMLDSRIEWKNCGNINFHYISHVLASRWLSYHPKTSLKPREVFETSALWPGNVCQACPFAVKVGWAAAEALSKKQHSKLEVQKIHCCFWKRYMLHPFCCITCHHLSCHFACVQPLFRRFLDQGVKRTIRSTNSWRRCCRTGHVFWGTVIIRW